MSDVVSKTEGKKMGMMIDPEEILGYPFARRKDGFHQRATVKEVDVKTKFYYTGILDWPTGHY